MGDDDQRAFVFPRCVLQKHIVPKLSNQHILHPPGSLHADANHYAAWRPFWDVLPTTLHQAELVTLGGVNTMSSTDHKRRRYEIHVVSESWKTCGAPRASNLVMGTSRNRMYAGGHEVEGNDFRGW